METSLLKSKTSKVVGGTCFHCGENYRERSIVFGQKSFCCEGCKMVYSILHENNLDNYYQINEAAGRSRKTSGEQEYAYLDDPETAAKLIDFTDSRITKLHFYLPQIHCSACLWLLENLHRLHDGIRQSRVDFLKKEVSITFTATELSLRELASLLDKIGYAPLIRLDKLDEEKRPVADKSLYYKLGLAGFAFGNIMLLSFPEYLGLTAESDATVVRFLGYVNILLILPVVFYAGIDYLRSAWQGLRHRHLNIDVPVSLGILALFFRSLYEILTHTGAGYLDSLAGLVFFLLIGKWFQQITYKKISFDRNYKSYFPVACNLKANGVEQSVALDKIKTGDTIVIRHGEMIPADALLHAGTANIDYSFVSGESVPVLKHPGEQLYAGGRQTGGMIEVVISKKVSDSYLAQLWNDTAFSKATPQGQASGIADSVAAVFTFFILLVASLTLIYWLPKDPRIAINAFTAVLIIACPCAVALSIPFTFGNVVRLFTRKGIYLKNTGVVETLAKINHIVFDKTGTISHPRSGELEYLGKELTRKEKTWIRTLANQSAHPASQSLSMALQNYEILPVKDFSEITGKGISGFVDGHFVRIGSAAFMGDACSGNEKLKQGVCVEVDYAFKGAFLHQSKYRKGLTKVLNKLRSLGEISLLSGDNDREQKTLLPLFRGEQKMHFNQKPEDKLAHIKSLQQGVHFVAMVGDGLNDAGALKQSDVGIVITENISNFTPACDVIMTASNFEKIPLLFAFSKQSIRVVYGAYLIALLYNIVGLTYAVQGALSPVVAAILMPLSSVSILFFGVGMSSWLAYKNGLW